jgi:zinc/manganese transport system permease protein
VLAFIARPLLFASVDPDVAEAAGVPARGLAIVFLILLGAAAAEASQITGSLLIFALLVLPPATAQAITSRPVLGLALSIGIGLLVTWTGLGIAYYSPYPIGFWITSIAFGLFVVARVAGHVPRRRLRVAS